MSIEAVIAANRFGLGARPGELNQIGSDPKGWLQQQVRGSRPVPPTIAALPSSERAFATYIDALRTRREARAEQAQADPAKLVVQGVRRRLAPLYSDQILARYQWASTTPESFRERLVHFWTNHFAVSAEKPQVLVLAGTLENEAVRPNLAGRFADLLLAVEKHPAMIFYLDNQASIGPNSQLARRARNPQRKFDINENLAREVLELHTLGVQGGYTQQDVTTFAQILTGWSVNAGRGRLGGGGSPGTFVFRAPAHEPGTKVLLGKRYTQEGEAQVRAVLNDLARHPATAEHLARKLVTHFVADEPPPAAVARIAKVFRDSDGSLPEVHAALADLPEAWSSKASKYKTPHEFVVSAFRATGVTPQIPQQVVAPLQLLGQAPYRPGSPAGWPDTASQWDGPDALLKRVEWAAQAATHLASSRAPLELATQSLGAGLSEHTRTAIGRAMSAAQGITLWLASPEFLRR